MKNYPSVFLSEVKREEIWKKYRGKRNAILALSIAIVLVLFMFKNYSTVLRTLSAIGLIAVFYLADHLFDIEFKRIHYVFIIVIAISSFLLSPLYFIYPNYDKVQHLIQPILVSAIAFFMISRLKIRLRWKLTFTFFVVMGILGLHEIGEYLLDYFFDLKMQGVFLRNLQGLEKFDILQDRIDDTMIDMSLGVLGSLVYVLYVGYTKMIRRRV